MKNIFRLTAVALLAATLFSACTGAFEDMNTNPKGVSDEELKQDNNYIGMHFIPMMQSIYYNKNAGVNVWEYQLIQNLNADLWSGYISTATAFAGNVSNVTYAMNAGWNDNCWDYAYSRVLPTNTDVLSILTMANRLLVVSMIQDRMLIKNSLKN